MPKGIFVRTEEHNKNISIANTGKKRSKDAIENYKKANKITQNRPEVNEKRSKTNTGKTRNEETKRKMRKIQSEIQNRPEVKEKKRIARIKYMKEQYDSGTIKWCNTLPERIMYEGLLSEGYIVAKQFEVEGVGLVDFYLPDYNLVIEVDGDYWHANPKEYEVDKVLYNNLTAKQIWDKDKRRNKKLKELGYDVLRFWEHDIKKDLNGCMNKIETELNKL